MIPKDEVLKEAGEKGLLSNVVEKDYVLGWILMGIARHPVLQKWIFKGGTCLKKCFFETFRFSQDLDFTIPQEEVYDAQVIYKAIIECTENINEETGLFFPEEGIEIKESFDKCNRKTFVGKISYRGPLLHQTKTLPRIKLDLTKHEVVVDNPKNRPIHHFFSDSVKQQVSIRCYTVNEILAEKTRALYERKGRARDVYDVVNIIRYYYNEINPKKAREILQKKFTFKELILPTIENYLKAIDFESLEANWGSQLKHQLPVLPPIQFYITELKTKSLQWIEAKPIKEDLEQISISDKEKPEIKSPYPDIPLTASGQHGINISYASVMHRIRYAARNRLCVEIVYNNIHRLTEPYSLRYPETGNLLLYVYERKKDGFFTGQIKAYNIEKIQSVRITSIEFQPRYLVEL